MAEALLRVRCADMGRTDLTVTSMGIHGLDTQPATSLGVQVCAENGVDITQHRSRPLSGKELMDADLIFAMEMVQKDFITLFFPHVADRVFLMGSWPADDNKRDNVRDPMGRSIRVYRDIFNIIDREIRRIAPVICGMM